MRDKVQSRELSNIIAFPKRASRFKHPPKRDLRNAEALRREVWNTLKTVPGEDPSKVRSVGGTRVSFADYGWPTAFGWVVDKGEVVTWRELVRQGRP